MGESSSAGNETILFAIRLAILCGNSVLVSWFYKIFSYTERKISKVHMWKIKNQNNRN